MKALKLREGIVAVIQNSRGEILLFERADHTGSFQFPQGGIEKSETPKQALFRELLEEIGNNKIIILAVGKDPTVYVLPKPIKGFDGARQNWFLCQLEEGEIPNLAISDQCFKSYKWVQPNQVLSEIVIWKREPFLKGLKQLGVLS